MGRLEADFRVSYLFSLIAGLLSGMAGAMGLGGGSVLIIYLTLFADVNQLAAQGINLIFFLPTAAVAVFIYSKKGIIKWRKILPIMLWGVIGTLVSGWLVGFFSAKLVKKLFGIVIAVYGLYELFGKEKIKSKHTKLK